MVIPEYRTYCLAFPGTTEEFPFNNKTLVFKVMGKMTGSQPGAAACIKPEVE